MPFSVTRNSDKQQVATFDIGPNSRFAHFNDLRSRLKSALDVDNVTYAAGRVGSDEVPKDGTCVFNTDEGTYTLQWTGNGN